MFKRFSRCSPSSSSSGGWCCFAVLPFGVRTQTDDQDVTLGTNRERAGISPHGPRHARHHADQRGRHRRLLRAVARRIRLRCPPADRAELLADHSPAVSGRPSRPARSLDILPGQRAPNGCRGSWTIPARRGAVPPARSLAHYVGHSPPRSPDSLPANICGSPAKDRSGRNSDTFSSTASDGLMAVERSFSIMSRGMRWRRLDVA